MSFRASRQYLLALVACAGCGESKSAPKPAPATIEARDASGVIARVTTGRPCRATVGDFELIVGGPPLVAQHGSDRWTGEASPTGFTLSKNDQIVARIHAKQLFDAEGVPVVRVLDNGDITGASNAVVRTAKVDGGTTKIGDITVTTTDVVLAAFLTAREALPEVRALAACHLVIGT